MPTKVIREPGHADALAIILKGRKFPLTVTWAHPVRKLKPRTYGTPLFRWTMTVVVWALVVTVIVQVAG